MTLPRFEHPQPRSPRRASAARKTIGIIGGMGPAATVDFFRRVVEATAVESEQDHIHLIIDNDPSIPDRSLALVGSGASPVPHLVAAARRLETAGVDLLVMPCNTAHAFFEEIQAAVQVPLVSWIDEVANALLRLVPRRTRVGILATTGTIAADLYQEALRSRGLTPVIPSLDEQATLMESIYGPNGIKRGFLTQPGLLPILEGLVGQGAPAIVVACTDLSALQLDDVANEVIVVDAAALVAERIVVLAGGATRRSA
jgi:aspartate racemase